MKIGVIGSGEVATTLAAGFLKHGHDVMLGSREPEKLSEWVAAFPKANVGYVAEAAAFGDLVVLAVKGLAAVDAAAAAGAANLDGKPVIDVTNPISDAPPHNGVLTTFTAANDSLLERLQRAFPNAHFVKAFNSVGAELMVDPKLESRPTMFICGNVAAAKTTVTAILEDFGWETADMGGVEAARAIEPLAMLWCIPGFLRDDWRHALKLLH
jgi:8-hydroxy-5-deazaflavin:NADPH oxidoreductase